MMQLAQLAVLFGLGEPSVGYYNNCEENYDAIKQCRDAMPILDMEEEKDMGSNIYPMISHLRKFQQPPEKATTKSARGSEPRKSQKLEGKEKDFLVTNQIQCRLEFIAQSNCFLLGSSVR